jgi:hypothetical protein
MFLTFFLKNGEFATKHSFSKYPSQNGRNSLPNKIRCLVSSHFLHGLNAQVYHLLFIGAC